MKSIKDFAFINLVLLLLLVVLVLFPKLPILQANFSKFLSFKEVIELILEIIFILLLLQCKLFKLSNECFDMRPLFINDEVEEDENSGVDDESWFNDFFSVGGTSSEKISDIFYETSTIKIKWINDCEKLTRL